MSVHYETIKIVEAVRTAGGPVTIDIQMKGDLRSVEMPEEEWREIVLDWAKHYESLDRHTPTAGGHTPTQSHTKPTGPVSIGKPINK